MPGTSSAELPETGGAAALAAPTPARSGRGDAVARHAAAGTLLAPAIILFTTFVALPMLEAGWYSFYRWNGFGWPRDWIGLRNYQVLFGNAAFASAVRNTALVIAVSLLLQLPVALGLALLVARRSRVSTVFRTIFFLP